MFIGPAVSDWLPDETLFSLVSRQHCLSGNTTTFQTCREAFGLDRLGPEANMLAVPGSFVVATRSRFGSAEEILMQHTVLPYYLPLASAKVRGDVWSSLTSEETSFFRYPMGQLTGRFCSHHPLKACADCVVDDRAAFGVAYWHRLHQLPSVWICPKHRSLLFKCVRSRQGGVWASFCLPDPQYPRSPPAIAEKDEKVLQSVLRIAQNSASYIQCAPQLFLERRRVSAVLAAQAIQLGAFDDAGKLDFHKCAQLLMQVPDVFSFFPELMALCQGERHVVSMARRIFASEFRLSTLHLMIAVLCMHGSWEAFMTAYQAQEFTGVGNEEIRMQRATRVFF